MAKNNNQKLKLLYIYEYLLEKTDENHPATVAEIIEYLGNNGIKAERKSIYSDIEELSVFGLDVITEKKNRNCYYYVGSRKFELAELKLIIDSVLASKFITNSKSKELIDKIATQTSVHNAKTLSKRLVLSERVKSMNESIYYVVDALYQAMNDDLKVNFQYYMWTQDKKLVPRNNGSAYEVSPWNLVWDDENYYLIAFDNKADKIKFFRVDKIKNISLSEGKRDGKNQYESMDISSFGKKIFGMFDGQLTRVTIEFENYLAGVVYDRFGPDVASRKLDDEHFVINTQVIVSNQFYGWLVGLGKGAKLTGPEASVTDFRQYVANIMKQY